MCILQGTFCDTGIPCTFYGGDICSVPFFLDSQKYFYLPKFKNLICNTRRSIVQSLNDTINPLINLFGGGVPLQKQMFSKIRMLLKNHFAQLCSDLLLTWRPRFFYCKVLHEERTIEDCYNTIDLLQTIMIFIIMKKAAMQLVTLVTVY